MDIRDLWLTGPIQPNPLGCFGPLFLHTETLPISLPSPNPGASPLHNRRRPDHRVLFPSLALTGHHPIPLAPTSVHRRYHVQEDHVGGEGEKKLWD
jgi:hypothetical protein